MIFGGFRKIAQELLLRFGSKLKSCLQFLAAHPMVIARGLGKIRIEVNYTWEVG